MSSGHGRLAHHTEPLGSSLGEHEDERREQVFRPASVAVHKAILAAGVDHPTAFRRLDHVAPAVEMEVNMHRRLPSPKDGIRLGTGDRSKSAADTDEYDGEEPGEQRVEKFTGER
jgi:hypothetical protein